MDRRSFIKTNAAVLASSGLPVAARPGEESSPSKPDRKIGYIGKLTAPLQDFAYPGKRYEELVPDTLDLQERATLAINGLTGPTDPEADHEIYFAVFFGRNKPVMSHDISTEVQPKFQEALPLMRLISGDDQGCEVERGWMEATLKMQGPDGLLYHPVQGRPWFAMHYGVNLARFREEAEPEGRLPPVGYRPRLRRLPAEIEETGHLGSTISNGRTLGVLALYYRLTGDNLWKQVGQRIVEGLRGIRRSPFWPGCERSEKLSEVPANPWIIQGLSQFFKMTGYEPALDLAGSAVERLKQAAWTAQGETMEGFLESSRKGKLPARAPFGWGGAPGRRPHFHSTTIGLLATLEYAALRGDRQLMALVREGYEYAKLLGETTVGYFPERATHLWSSSIEDRADFRYETSEACEVADMIALGLKLTHLGQGDYWDDVDRWLRNQFIESQLTDIEWVYRMTEDLPEMHHDPSFQTTERVPERNLGAFAGWPSVNDWYTGAPHTRDYYPEYPGQAIMHCCTGNAARAIYYAWEHILEQKKDKVRVNLLLNRASPWIDLHSHIPYEGRIAIQVKKACELSVRIPEWVSPAETACTVNSLQRSPGWQGRYAALGRLRPGDSVEVTFGIGTQIEDISVQGSYYKIARKGNEVVTIDPAGRYNAFYQRAHYGADSTRWRKANRFLSDNSVDW